MQAVVNLRFNQDISKKNYYKIGKETKFKSTESPRNILPNRSDIFGKFIETRSLHEYMIFRKIGPSEYRI